MSTTIKLKYGSGAPTSLAQGEPAIDVTNKRLYTSTNGSDIIEVGSNPSSLTTSSVDINGGNIDGTPIGASSPSTGAFTTLSASSGITGNLTGTIQTAAQGNITSLGTLTSLNVDGKLSAYEGSNYVTANSTSTLAKLKLGTSDSVSGNRAEMHYDKTNDVFTLYSGSNGATKAIEVNTVQHVGISGNASSTYSLNVTSGTENAVNINNSSASSTAYYVSGGVAKFGRYNGQDIYLGSGSTNSNLDIELAGTIKASMLYASGNLCLRAGNGDGYGITFDTLSHNANTTLDWYEQGTFTPAFADASSGGNTATSAATGSYTRIGNVVTCVLEGTIFNVGLTGSNVLYMTNLPFDVKSSLSFNYVPIFRYGGLNLIGQTEPRALVFQISGGQSYMGFMIEGNNTYAGRFIECQEIDSGGFTFYSTFTYLAED